MESFICDDCQKKISKNKRVYEQDICLDCLEDYENKTGYCSAYCRITEKCDGSC